MRERTFGKENGELLWRWRRLILNPMIELFRVFVCLCVVAFERERDGAMEDGWWWFIRVVFIRVYSCILNSLYIYTESKLLRWTLADADALAEVLVFEFSSTSVAIVAIAIVGISSSIIEVIKVA